MYFNFFLRPMTSSLVIILALTSTSAYGHHRAGHNGGPGGGCEVDCEEPPTPPPPTTADSNWMHADVGAAHDLGWDGTGTIITVIDDFLSGDTFAGRLDSGLDGVWTLDDIEQRTHGYWTLGQTQMVAPGADHEQIDFASTLSFSPTDGTFDAVNLSYGLIARNVFASAYDDWTLLGNPHSSVLEAVSDNLAFAAKAAGNDSKAVGASVKGTVDVFAQQFINVIDGWDTSLGTTAPIIFVGALDWNADGTGAGGTSESLASYSSYAGSNTSVQDHFLVVGVEGGRTATDALANYGSLCGSVEGTCLYGTSFAAPIVTGYAAIVAQKFTVTNEIGAVISVPTPSLVADKLLSTAITSSIFGYSPSLHGQGEASLINALAPITITGN